MTDSKIIEVDGAVTRETAAAYYFTSNMTGNGAWVPKSKCEWDMLTEVMQIPEWMAQQKELI